MCVGEGQQVWRREIKRKKHKRRRRGSMWEACWELWQVALVERVLSLQWR